MNFETHVFYFCLFPFVLFYFFKVRLWTSLCSRLHIFARRTARKYMTYITVASTGFIPHNLSAKEDLRAFITQNN